MKPAPIIAVISLLLLLAVPHGGAYLPAPAPAEELPAVSFYVTDLDYSAVVPACEGGSGVPEAPSAARAYLDVSAGSRIASCRFSIAVPEEFVSVTGASFSWAGGIYALTLAQIDEGAQASDLFTYSYEASEGSIEGGIAVSSFDHCGVQLGGGLFRFTLRLDRAPAAWDCLRDGGGYYLPLGLTVRELSFALPGGGAQEAGPGSFTARSGRLYVTPEAGTAPESTPEPTAPPSQKDVVFSVGTVQNASVGKISTVPLTIGGPELPASGLSLRVSFDAACLTPVFTAAGSVWRGLPEDAMTIIDAESEPGVIAVDILCPGEPFTGRGLLLAFDFCAGPACADDLPISVEVEEFFFVPPDGAASPIPHRTEPGGICFARATVTYTGAYQGSETVLTGGAAHPPVCAEPGMRYSFSAHGEPWDGACVTQDVTVLVTL